MKNRLERKERSSVLLESVHRHPDQVAHATEESLLPSLEAGGQARADALPNVDRSAGVRLLQTAGEVNEDRRLRGFQPCSPKDEEYV